ncbi:hypothetical protein FG93_03456 [Bosea sp. LC85]|uniref:hypothetical protein n=1 Tax=Bosea sp. LC85 TaxID=1502851 RepID=UPI0004E46FF8|nr:hypothetical protein [Bosea sp. LC85]KFC69410.1 hypothetical protein FG93_03456 [Bosea sp. LC85]
MILKHVLWPVLLYGLFFCASFGASFAGLIWLTGAAWDWPLSEGHRGLAVMSFFIAAFATDRFWRVFLLGE